MLENQKIIPFYNPSIYDEKFFSLLSKLRESIFINFNQYIHNDDFFTIPANSKEFKIKTEELRRYINDIKKKDQKKQKDDPTLFNLITESFDSIQNSSLSKEEKQIIYVQHFFSLWESISDQTKENLKEYDKQNIIKLIYDYKTNQEDENILKYYWYYLYTNHYTQCKDLSLENFLIISDFFLYYCLYSNNEFIFERKSELIIYFFPFIETCFQLYKEIPSHNIFCLFIIESYIDGTVFHIISLFTELFKTIKVNHLTNVWQLLLQILFPYLSCWVDIFPRNNGLIRKIILCICGIRSYYGSLRKLIEQIKMEQIQFILQDTQKHTSITNKENSDLKDSQEIFFDNIFDWKKFPENLIYSYNQYVGKTKNYLRYFIDLLSYFSDNGDSILKQQKDLYFYQPSIFQKYHFYSNSFKKENQININQSISSKSQLFPKNIDKDNYIKIFSFLLEPQLVELNKTKFTNLFRWFIHFPSENQFQSMFTKLSLHNIWNPYSGIILILSSLFNINVREETDEIKINKKSYIYLILKQLCSIIKNIHKVHVIPTVEIIAFISIILEHDNSKEEMDVIIEILTEFVNNLFNDYPLKKKLFIFLEDCFKCIYRMYIKGTMPSPFLYVMPLIKILTTLLRSCKYGIEKSSMLLSYLGMSFDFEAFNASCIFCIEHYLIANEHMFKYYDVIYFIFEKWKEIIINNDVYIKQFNMLEKCINDNCINIINFLCNDEQKAKTNFNTNMIYACLDLYGDVLCELIVASKSKSEKTNKIIYEDLITKLFTLTAKYSIEVKNYKKEEIKQNNNMNPISSNELQDKLQFKVIKNLLIKLNSFEYVNKMTYLINILFHNHNIPNKDVDFSCLTSEIIQYMYLDINNKVYFDFCISNIHMKNPCLYGNSLLSNKPPQNAVILNTNHILLSLIKGLSSKKYKYQKLKFISRSLNHIYLINENSISEYFNVINQKDIFKGLIKKEGIAQVICEIFSTLTTFIKPESTLCITSKDINDIDKNTKGIYFNKHKDKISIKMKYFNLINRFLLDICHKQTKYINTDSLLVPPYIEDSLSNFLGSMVFYYNSILIDKKINYTLCRNTMQCKKGSIVQTDLEEYITLLCELFIGVININLSLPILYLLFIMKELIVAFNYEDIFRCFWLCFMIRWPKYSNNILSLWRLRCKARFSKEIMNRNIQMKNEHNKQISLINYLSEYLCYYYLQYLHDERLYENNKNETDIYKEILHMFDLDKNGDIEEEIMFLDTCQSFLFGKQSLMQMNNDEEKEKIMNNIDNSMLFVSKTQIIMVNNEKVLDNIKKRDKNRLHLKVISPTYINTVYVEDYIDNNNDNNTSWKQGVKQLLFDISNLNVYPFQIYQQIDPIEEKYKSNLLEFLLRKENISFDISILIVPFSYNILSKYNAFFPNVNNNSNLIPFIKFLSCLGTITQKTNESFIITHKEDLYSLNFNVISKNPSIKSQIDFVKKNNIHILYTENPNQPQNSFENFYDDEISSNDEPHMFIIINHIIDEYFLIKRRWNNKSSIDEYLDKILINDYVINLHIYSGIRYFINSLILYNEVIRMKNMETCTNVFSERINLFKSIIDIQHDNQYD